MIIIIDLSSSVLPFNFYFIKSLRDQNIDVIFFCSVTEYNSNYLKKIEDLGVEVKAYSLSQSTRRPILYRAYELIKAIRKIWVLRANSFTVISMFNRFIIIDLLLRLIFGSRAAYLFHNPENRDDNVFTSTARKFRKFLYRRHWFASEFYAAKADSGMPAFKSIAYVQHGTMPLDDKPVTQYQKSHSAFRQICFWGNAKPYKGISDFVDLCQPMHEELFDKLFVIGKGARIIETGEAWIEIQDVFYSEIELASVLTPEKLYFLPYKQISQSGVFYTLLAQGLYFSVTDRGEPAYLFRKFGLQNLIMSDGNPLELSRCRDWLIANRQFCCEKFQSMQDWALPWRIAWSPDDDVMQLKSGL